MSKIAMLLVSSLLLVACGDEDFTENAIDPDEEEMTSEVGSAIKSPQGRSSQGRSSQGRSSQGTEAGTYAAFAAYIGSAQVMDLKLDKTTLRGTLAGQSISGQAFVGARISQTSPDGDVMDATIDAIEQDATDPTGETWLYTLKVTDGTSGTKANMCLPDAKGVSKAIPVRGSWDDTGARRDDGRFTFGCTSGVIAKCVRWGYRPWATYGGVSLADHHQACTRMARADYCGDGTSHTEDGTTIEYYDKLGINTNTAGPLSFMFFDGAWTPEGAYCIGKERWFAVDLATDVLPLGLSCKNRFLPIKSGFPFLQLAIEPSPVSNNDLCLVGRSDVQRSRVLIDNRSYINLSL